MGDKTTRRVSWGRRILWTSAGLLLLAWAVPMVVRVNYWKQEITDSLSEAFHRPVRTGDIRPQLLGGLGLQIESVILEEDPRFGIEPFARMERLEARVALRSFWKNRVEFSSLTFVRPSLNVVRNAAGEWNLESFGRGEDSPGDVGAAPAASESLYAVIPQIRVESGRINFKSGNQKKSYMLHSLDMELLPPAAPRQPWKFYFEGTPGRTDLPLRPASRWQAEGEFGPLAAGIQDETGIPLRMDWRTEDALLADLLGVLAGKDFGLHGTVSLQGRLAGTTSLLRLTAQAKLHDVHRWDLMPSHDAPTMPVEIAGIVDLEAQSVQLTSLSVPVGDGSVVLRGRIEGLLNKPRVETEAELRQIPLASVAAIARRFTTRLDPRLAAQGSLDGRVGMSGPFEDLFASLEFHGAALVDTQSAQVIRVSDFPVLLRGKKGFLGPLDAQVGDGEPLRVSARWDWAESSSELHLSGEAVPLPALLRWAERLGAGWDQADPVDAEQGEVALRLDVIRHGGEPPQVGGWARISDAAFRLAKVSQPVRIADARLQFQKEQVRVRPLLAALGPVEVRGSLVAKWSPPEPESTDFWREVSSIEFRLDTPIVEVDELAGLLATAGQSRTFAWFRRNGEREFPFQKLPPILGVLRAASIRYGGFEWKDVAASLRWHDRQLEVADFKGGFAGGTQRGTAAVFFSPDPPAFQIETQYSNLDLELLAEGVPAWRGLVSGSLSGELRLSGRGRRSDDILRQLSGSGEGTGEGVALRGLNLTASSEPGAAGETRFARLSTAFRIARSQIHISELRATLERPRTAQEDAMLQAASWRISGMVGFDGTLDLVAQQDPGGGEWRWAGTLWEPHVTQSGTRPSAGEANASLRPE